MSSQKRRPMKAARYDGWSRHHSNGTQRFEGNRRPGYSDGNTQEHQNASSQGREGGQRRHMCNRHFNRERSRDHNGNMHASTPRIQQYNEHRSNHHPEDGQEAQRRFDRNKTHRGRSEPGQLWKKDSWKLNDDYAGDPIEKDQHWIKVGPLKYTMPYKKLYLENEPTAEEKRRGWLSVEGLRASLPERQVMEDNMDQGTPDKLPPWNVLTQKMVTEALASIPIWIPKMVDLTLTEGKRKWLEDRCKEGHDAQWMRVQKRSKEKGYPIARRVINDGNGKFRGMIDWVGEAQGAD